MICPNIEERDYFDCYQSTYWVMIDNRTNEMKQLQLYTKGECTEFLNETYGILDNDVTLLVPYDEGYGSIRNVKVRLSTQRKHVLEHLKRRYSTFKEDSVKM